MGAQPTMVLTLKTATLSQCAINDFVVRLGILRSDISSLAVTELTHIQIKLK